MDFREDLVYNWFTVRGHRLRVSPPKAASFSGHHVNPEGENGPAPGFPRLGAFRPR